MSNPNLFERDYFQKNSVYKKFPTPLQGATALANYYFGFYRLAKDRYWQNLDAPFRVLELGCGYSGLLPHFLIGDNQYVGLDISRYLIGEMKKIYPSAVLVNHDIQLPLEGLGQFDLVLALEVLEHVADLNNALRNIYALLAPGGLFVATVPNPRSKIPFTDWRRDPTHVSIFTKEVWREKFEAASFLKVKTETIFSIPFFWRFGRRLSHFFTLPEFGASILITARRYTPLRLS